MIDQMSKMMKEALWHIDAAYDEYGWDQEPGLFTVLVHNPTEMVDGMRVGILELRPVPAWSTCLAAMGGNPVKALSAMATMLAAAPQALKRDAFPVEAVYGMAFISEAWMLTAASEDEAAELRHASTLENHPDRIEVRTITCVSKDGEMCALNHERDGVVQHMDPISTASIPELLTTVLDAVVM